MLSMLSLGTIVSYSYPLLRHGNIFFISMISCVAHVLVIKSFNVIGARVFKYSFVFSSTTMRKTKVSMQHFLYFQYYLCIMLQHQYSADIVILPSLNSILSCSIFRLMNIVELLCFVTSVEWQHRAHSKGIFLLEAQFKVGFRIFGVTHIVLCYVYCFCLISILTQADVLVILLGRFGNPPSRMIEYLVLWGACKNLSVISKCNLQ